MRLRSAPVILASLLVVACGARELSGVQQYLQDVEPIADAYTEATDKFEKAIPENAQPDPAAFTEISDTLKGTLDDLRGVNVEEEKLREAHAHLIRGHELIKQAVDMVSGALANPTTIPADFEQQVTLLVDTANTEIVTWQKSVAELLPEEDREEFLRE